MKKIFFALLSVILIAGCAVQKRKYQKGYYVSWHGSKANTNTVSQKHTEISKTQTKKVYAQPELILAKETKESPANSLNTQQELKQPLKANKLAPPDSCDKLIFKNGNEEMVKVLEIGPDEISYKKCNMPDGPKYVTRKADVFSITFRNGVREVFPNSPPQNNSPSRTPSGGYNGPDNRDNDEAITSLLLGLAGLFLGFGSIPAIVVGIRALRKIRDYPKKYKGEAMAQVGIALGVIKLAIIFLLIVLIFLAI